MSGLYQRALEIYRQTVGLRLVGKGEEGLDIEDVSPEDREKILRQINEVIDRNRLKVQPGTFAITAKRSGIGLPIVVNGAVAVVVIAVILIFSFLFNRQEDVLAAGTGAILSTESKLIETLRQESQEQLQEKDRAIRSFQEQLQQTLEQQRRLEAETDEALRQREQQLEEQYQRAVVEERQRLLDQGLTEAAIADRLRAFEAEQRTELETEFQAYRRQTEEAAAEREAALAGLVREYEQNLQAAQSERSDLERQLQQRETELQQQFEARTQALESDRARVAAQLARLQEQQSQEQLVRDQILAAYQSVNESIAVGEYALALEQLESIRTYLGQEPARSLAGIQRRRPIELFIINSLEDLIRSRAAEEQRDLESLIGASTRIKALDEGIGTANRLFEQGDAAAARRQYISALGEIPSALEGHEKLTEIEARRQAQSRSQARQTVNSTLSQGRSLFESAQYQASLQRYREALNLLLEDAAAAGRIVDQIAEISVRLTPAAPPEPAVQPDEQTLAQIEQYRSRIAELEGENTRLKDQLAALQDQQQLLQGDQVQVAAQIKQLQEDKAALSTAAEQLRSEQVRLSAQVTQLQADNRRLTSERDALQSQREQLTAERDRLAEQLKNLQDQQQLLQGDQVQVAAQIKQLQEDKAALSVAAEQLRQEQERLSVKVTQLQADNQKLTSEREGLTAQITRLEADKSRLSSEQDRLTGQITRLESDNRRLGSEQERLLSQRDELQQELDRLAEQQRSAEAAEATREDLRERLTTLESSYQAQRRTAGLSGITPPATLAELLEAKLLTWQIIGSDPVASQYPELYDTMDRYLESLTEQSEVQGRYEAVEDIITVVDVLLSPRQDGRVQNELWRRFSYTDQEDLLARLLDKLELLLE